MIDLQAFQTWLDAIIIALEATTDPTRRARLRWCKRMTKLRIPKGGTR
jgi:hypothetical protein